MTPRGYASSPDKWSISLQSTRKPEWPFWTNALGYAIWMSEGFGINGRGEESYRGYLISGLAVSVAESDDGWFSPQGYAYRLENGRTVQVRDCRSKAIFKSQRSAERKALRLMSAVE